MNSNKLQGKWIQYKGNPHIQKNTITGKFRCKTCNKRLNDNPGGVGKHCRYSHGIRIDGSPIVKPENKVEIQRKPVLRQESEGSRKYRELFSRLDQSSASSPTPNIVQSYTSHYDIHRYSLGMVRKLSNEEKFDRKKELWNKYKEGKKEGVPEEILKILQDGLGLNDYEIEKELEKERDREASKILDLFDELLKRGMTFEDAQFACTILYENRRKKFT